MTSRLSSSMMTPLKSHTNHNNNQSTATGGSSKKDVPFPFLSSFIEATTGVRPGKRCNINNKYSSVSLQED
jgi:hypothetical protein